MEQTSKRNIHHGRNVQKFRLIRDKSQVDVAVELEELLRNPVSQQFISDLENKEVIDDEVVLKQIAEILKVDMGVIKHLDWDAAITAIGSSVAKKDRENKAVIDDQVLKQSAAITIVGSSFTTNDQAPATNQPIQSTINQTFNPLDELSEMFEKEKAELKAGIEKLKKTNR